MLLSIASNRPGSLMISSIVTEFASLSFFTIVNLGKAFKNPSPLKLFVSPARACVRLLSSASQEIGPIMPSILP